MYIQLRIQAVYPSDLVSFNDASADTLIFLHKIPPMLKDFCGFSKSWEFMSADPYCKGLSKQDVRLLPFGEACLII
jgi:hypothetical protein